MVTHLTKEQICLFQPSDNIVGKLERFILSQK